MRKLAKWKRKLTAADLRHIKETTNRNTLEEIRRNVLQARIDGVICHECQVIARKLGITN